MKKHILLGVTGGIAAYKMLDVASRLIKKGYEVNTIMTENACQFVQPLAFETITNNYVVTDTFARGHKWEVEHIALAKKTDLCFIAPATANIIGKIANGIADDMLSTTVMAVQSPVALAPAMNTAMYENLIVQKNIAFLKEMGYHFIEPITGHLACGDTGKGKLPDPQDLVMFLENLLKPITLKKDLQGKKILISAGPTVEALDPMRYISNHSTGKMGYAIAECAAKRGAEVVLVSGPTNLVTPNNVKRINVQNARQMKEAMFNYYDWSDAVIKTAAVADYRPKNESVHKIKKSGNNLILELTPNPDILKLLGEKKTHQVLVGFAAETQNVVDYAKEKIKTKNLDFIVANNIAQEGAGFKGDTNIVTIINAQGQEKLCPLMSKSTLGNVILDEIKTYWKER
jgi:phosphopantothenoylcysteine decarboxylase/phosphopantothenate--cysteine ligase